MIDLLIPLSYESLLPQLAVCFETARQQGFDTENVKISLVEQEYFEVSVDGTNKFIWLSDSISSKLFQHRSDRYALFYAPHRVLMSDTTSSSMISIGSFDSDVQSQNNEYDTFVSNEERFQIKAPAVDWNLNIINKHLTWLLIGLCLEFTVEDSMILARAAINNPSGVSRETWPLDLSVLDQITPCKLGNEELAFNHRGYNFLAVDMQSLALYPVVDNVDWVKRLLKSGVKTIQLRIKDHNQPDLEKQIIEAIELGNLYHAQLFINDYWQLAIKHKAYGVHLGQDDLITANLEQISKAGLRLGVSTHGYSEILNAVELKPSYIALGHIFPTTTKDMPSKPQGLIKLTLYQKLLADLCPTVAIGGIDLSTARAVWRTGVTSLAVVRAITQADDIQLAVDSFYQIMALNTSKPNHLNLCR